MFSTYGSYLYNRSTSIKGQKLVSEVVKHGEDQNGLVQVRTRGIHDDWPEESLPWVQMKGGFGSGNNQGTTDATKQIPPVGSKIFTEFEDNSHYHGVYHGGSATDDKKIPEFTGDNYGNTYGHADPGGNLHRVGTEEGKEFIERTHKTGSGDNFDKDGNYSNKAAGGHIFEGQKDGHFKYKGKLIFEAEGGIEIRGMDIKSTKPIEQGAAGPQAPDKPQARSRPTYNKPGNKL